MSCRRRLWLILLILSGFVGFGTVDAQTSAIAGTTPATVYIIRHAEKLTDGQIDLSAKGLGIRSSGELAESKSASEERINGGYDREQRYRLLCLFPVPSAL